MLHALPHCRIEHRLLQLRFSTFKRRISCALLDGALKHRLDIQTMPKVHEAKQSRYKQDSDEAEFNDCCAILVSSQPF